MSVLIIIVSLTAGSVVLLICCKIADKFSKRKEGFPESRGR